MGIRGPLPGAGCLLSPFAVRRTKASKVDAAKGLAFAVAGMLLAGTACFQAVLTSPKVLEPGQHSFGALGAVSRHRIIDLFGGSGDEAWYHEAGLCYRTGVGGQADVGLRASLARWPDFTEHGGDTRTVKGLHLAGDFRLQLRDDAEMLAVGIGPACVLPFGSPIYDRAGSDRAWLLGAAVTAVAGTDDYWYGLAIPAYAGFGDARSRLRSLQLYPFVGGALGSRLRLVGELGLTLPGWFVPAGWTFPELGVGIQYELGPESDASREAWQ